jgi:hypothetical protein
LNGKVPGYDVDSQFEILVQTIEMERETARLHKRESWTAIFKGVDGVRLWFETISVRFISSGAEAFRALPTSSVLFCARSLCWHRACSVSAW